MERAVQQIAALIDHLRLESLSEQDQCFYCGGFHRSVDCDSPKRKAFHRILVDIASDFEELQDDLCVEGEGGLSEVRVVNAE